MNQTLKQVLFWLPRSAGILFVAFISLFAMDVFDSQADFWQTLGALFMHLIPSILLAMGIIVGWKREWLGAAFFIGWAFLYVLSFQEFELLVYILIAGLPALIGLLFLAGWVWRRQIREG